MSAVAARAERLASSMAVRALLPIFFLVFHVVVLSALAKERFGLPFNSAPGAAPSFTNPAVEPIPANWSRLIVSRWDSQHYITIGLRGYEYCAPRAALGPNHYPDSDVVCQLNFFPGYALIGAAASRLLHVPIDYALFGVSLVASYFAMFLWTSKEIVSALGSVTTLASLTLLNFFTTGYELVTLQTEPPSLLLTMATFVLLERKRLLPAALCAGAASIIRPTGIAISAAFVFALLAQTLRERPSWKIVLSRGALSLLSAWGLIALFSFFQVRFGDALVYAHARERYYHYSPNLLALFSPSYKWLAQSLWAAPNEGMWLAAGLLWFALGHRAALSGFTRTGRVYWYALYFLTVGISAASQVTIGFSGMSRYLLLAVPLFFAMAAAMRRSVAAFVLWCIISLAHYWSVNACFYVGRSEPGFWQICHIQPGA
jgi:hypothetical protein